MDQKKIGALIAAMRKEKGLTQKELGQRLHVSDRAVSKWERGLNLPDAAQFEPLCQELDLTLTELLRGEREDAAAPDMEQLLSDAMELAKRKEQEAWRRLTIRQTLLALFLAALFFLGHWGMEQVRERQHQAQDYVMPQVTLWGRTGDQSIVIEPRYGGHRVPSSWSDHISQADLRITFPRDDLVIQDLPRVDGATYSSLRLGLEFDKPGMELKILRWPDEVIGTPVTLEDGEEVEWSEARRFGLMEDFAWACTFAIEPGYAYSQVFFWGDGYYMEYPFRVI